MVFLGYVCFATVKNKEDSNSLHYIQNKVFLLIWAVVEPEEYLDYYYCMWKRERQTKPITCAVRGSKLQN